MTDYFWQVLITLINTNLTVYVASVALQEQELDAYCQRKLGDSIVHWTLLTAKLLLKMFLF